MYLAEQKITLAEAVALRNYISKTGPFVNKRVYKLIIDSCGATDEAFGQILEGIYNQSLLDITTGKVKMQYLHSLIYSNNEFGIKSLEMVEKIIPNLFELVLNNVQLGGYMDRERIAFSNILEKLLRITAMNGNRLMKLKLTKMNLRYDGLIQSLCDTLKFNKNMVMLDVSLGSLLPKQLRVLS